jgi:hypothetical protein
MHKRGGTTLRYDLLTYQGLNMTMADSFDFTGFVAAINSPEVQAVAISEISTLKSNIKTIKPVYAEGETPIGDKVTIYPRNGEPFTAYVENFDATAITSQINTQRNTFILIGDTAIHRNEYSIVMAAQ